MLSCILLALLVVSGYAQPQPEGNRVPVESANATLKVPIEDDICNVNAIKLPNPKNPAEFFDCIQPDDWAWPNIGLWKKLSCEPGHLFVVQNQTCLKERTVRRHALGGFCHPPPCAPAPPVIPVPCPHASGGAVACPGCPCSWMLDPLAIDPNTPHGYLQCRPAFPGIYCGVWQPMPCAPGTRFDLNVQVCVHDECARPPCSGGCPGGFAIGACQGGGCPGNAVCQAGSCCGGGGWGKRR